MDEDEGLLLSSFDDKTIAELLALSASIKLPFFVPNTKNYKGTLRDLLASASPYQAIISSKLGADLNAQLKAALESDSIHSIYNCEQGSSISGTIALGCDKSIYGEKIIGSPDFTGDFTVKFYCDINFPAATFDLISVFAKNVDCTTISVQHTTSFYYEQLRSGALATSGEQAIIEKRTWNSTTDDSSSIPFTVSANTTIVAVGGKNHAIVCTNNPTITLNFPLPLAYHFQITGACTLVIGSGVTWWGDEITAITTNAEISILNNVAVGVLYE